MKNEKFEHAIRIPNRLRRVKWYNVRNLMKGDE